MNNGAVSSIWPEWKIVRQIGRGSFGVVYEALRTDHQVESRAAIKVISVPKNEEEIDSLHSEGLSDDATKTYLQNVVDGCVGEIQLMETLKGVHNIVSVEDYKVVEKVGEVGWNIYIRMELLTPFSEFICNRTVSEEEVIKLGCDICTALEYCSKRNIIHRDIKPENIFCNEFGDYKLGDFGIARKLENITEGLSQKGTYSYMAPEVEKGTKYDATVDLYSLGLVMYRLMNKNRLPFIQDEKQQLNPNDRTTANRRRLDGEPLPKPCDASPAMAKVILCACNPDAKRRFVSATAMKNALASISAENETLRVRRPKHDDDRTIFVRRPQENVDRTGDGHRGQETGGYAAGQPAQPVKARKRPKDTAEIAYGGRHAAAPETAAHEGVGYKRQRKKGTAAALAAAFIALSLIAAGVVAMTQSRQSKEDKSGGVDAHYEDMLAKANNTENLDEAVKLFEEVISCYPDEVEAYRSYAYMLYRNGEYAECVSCMKEKAEEFNDTDLYLIMASAYFELSDFENAANLYYRVSLHSEDEMSIENLRDYAVCLGREGKLDEASSVLETLKGRGASTEVTDYVLGETYYAQEAYTNAKTAFLGVLDTTDEELRKRAYVSLAEVYRDTGDYESLIQLVSSTALMPELQSNFRLSEMLGAAYYARAEAEKSKADYILAAEAFQKTIDLGMQSQYLFENVCICYIRAEEYMLAKQALSRMESVFPKSYIPHALRAIVLMTEQNGLEEEQRDYTEAVSEYEAARQRVTAQDDQSYMRQLETLVQQLEDGGWLD